MNKFLAKRIVLRAFAAVVAVISNSTVLADGQASPEQVVTIGSRQSELAIDLPFGLSQLESKELALVSHNHIQEALLRVPGVSLQRGNGQEYLPAIRSPVLTGAGACGAFLTAQDGIPLRSAGFCNVNELFDAHTELAESVEVIRGPGPAVYGSNAVHGLVNVVTFDSLPGLGKKLGLEYGANNFSRLKWQHQDQFGAHFWGMKFTATHDGGYRDEANYDQQKLDVQHQVETDSWKITNGLAVSNLEQETAGFITGFESYRSTSLAKLNLNPEAFRNSRAVRLWSRLEQKNQKQRWVITPYARLTDMEFLQHFLPGDPLEENSQRSAGFQSAYYLDLTPNLTGVAGLDGEFTRGELKQSQERATVGSAFLVETVPSGKHYDYQVDASLVALFGNLEWRSNQWLLNIGGRLEYMHYDYDNRMLTGRTRDDGTACGFGGCRYSRPADGTEQFTNFSPKLGVSYQFAEDQKAYLNLTHGFRAPQATELFRLQRNQQTADLDSEEIQNIELGIRGTKSWLGRESLGYELSIYHMRKTNVIFRDSDFFNRDGGRTEHKGVELGLSIPLGSQLEIGINASYAKHRYDKDLLLNGININGNDVDTAPRHFGSARLGWKVTPSAKLELEWVHMGKYYLDAENLHQYKGHDVLNLRTQWQVVEGVSLYARLLNLTDKRYAERADFTSFTQERYFPGEPRSLFVGVEKTW